MGKRSLPVLDTWLLNCDVGVFGDGSLAFQDELTGRLRGWIEQAGR